VVADSVPAAGISLCSSGVEQLVRLLSLLPRPKHPANRWLERRACHGQDIYQERNAGWHPVVVQDLLFSHAKPRDTAQAELWKRLIANELTTPDTWKVALSSGGPKRTHWERLLTERKLGALNYIRELENSKPR
jgi:hypothetical protein